MSRRLSDPTANNAIGSIDRELNKKRKEAAKIARLYRDGKLTSAELAEARKQFRGICRNFLTDALAG